MVSFTTPASGANASQVTLGILSTNGASTISLTYTAPGGGTAADSFTFALPNDTSVVGWVNGSAVPINLPPMGQQDPIVSKLNGGLLTCGLLLRSWQTKGQNQAGGFGNNGLTAAEVTYANEFLISQSGNSQPPAQMTNPTAFGNAGNFRIFQRLQLSYEVSGGTIIRGTQRIVQNYAPANGVTPEPCTGHEVSLFALPSQPGPLNGTLAISADSSIIYQINEARLGPEGQAVNWFLNGVPGQNYALSTPWIWSVIQFDANGYTRAWAQGSNSSNLQIFPAYQVYTNGFALQPIPQANVFNFINLNSSSQFTVNQ